MKQRGLPGLRTELLRRSHSVAPYGVGSIIDLPHESVMPLSIDFWPENFGIEIHDPRLERRLGVTHFRMIPSNDEAPELGVPCTRFPRWLFCPKCRSLRDLDDWKRLYQERHGRPYVKPECYQDKVPLVPSRFIVVCPNGHIDDFPWVEWVHRNRGMCGSPDLEFRTGTPSSGLSGILIRCRSCDATTTMAGAFSENLHERCSGNMPWLRQREQCSARPRTLQRGASNVYFPFVVSSIAIPEPNSNPVEEHIRRSPWWRLLRDRRDLDEIWNVAIRDLARDSGRSTDEVAALLTRMLSETVSVSPEADPRSETDYRWDEYKVFSGEVTLSDSSDLSIEIRPGYDYGLAALERVTLVHRFREVRALVAFSRIAPLDRQEVPDEYSFGTRARPCFVKGLRARDWLPAVEVRGEGIFIEFAREPLQAWASEPWVDERARILSERYRELASRWGFRPRSVTPQLIFLHTFAHLLIRQLTFECGYGSASLRERLYVSRPQDDFFMAGILIYTASGDSDGTLGGLVRQGRPDKLPHLIRKAIVAAQWCSSDPLCIESHGQGLDSLNLAACHACALLPETSCEEFNRLLDRGLVVGTPENPSHGYAARLLYLT